VNKPITDQFISGMANGVPILGETTKKCLVTKESPFVFKIILIQGLNRQIRRMCEYFGYEVTKLVRTRIMNINLKGLPLGDWRDLTEQEMAGIYKMIENSSSEVSGSGKRSGTNKRKWEEKRPEKNHLSGKSFDRPIPRPGGKPSGKFKPKSEERSFNKPKRSKNDGTAKSGPGRNKSRPPKGKSSGRNRRSGR
jgi:23S rRNA pseudouridine2604 synthase